MASTTAQNYEQLSYGGSASQWRGQHKQIISDAVATRTLVPKEAGAMCCFDSASGVVYTLPPPVAGMTFEFVTTVTITSNSAKVITDSATTFLLGAVSIVNDGAANAESFLANGTTARSVNGNGTTTGGVAGDCFRVTAISSTQWFLEGVMIGSGTLATPIATS